VSDNIRVCLGILQLGFVAFIVRGLFFAVPRSFGFSHIHPNDAARPFAFQRVCIRESWGEREYIPRRNVWVSLVFVLLCALGWLLVFHYFGIFGFQKAYSPGQ